MKSNFYDARFPLLGTYCTCLVLSLGAFPLTLTLRKSQNTITQRKRGHFAIVFYRHFENIAQDFCTSVLETWLVSCTVTLHTATLNHSISKEAAAKC